MRLSQQVKKNMQKKRNGEYAITAGEGGNADGDI